MNNAEIKKTLTISLVLTVALSGVCFVFSIVCGIICAVLGAVLTAVFVIYTKSGMTGSTNLITTLRLSVPAITISI